MKKIVLAIVLLTMFAGIPAFAGRHGCPGGCHPCRPSPPPRPHHPCRPCHPGWGWRGNWHCSRDLGNAAAITGIVANGLAIANTICQPIVYSTPVAPIVQPTVAAPAVVTSPVTTVPAPVVYSQPVSPSIVVPAAAPVVAAPWGRAGRVVYYGY